MLNQYVETKLPRKKAWSKPKRRNGCSLRRGNFVPESEFNR